MAVKSRLSKGAFSLFKGSSANLYILKKYPLLATLHRTVDGALVGVIVSGAVMTTFALHSQHLWTVNFSRLQLTRDLAHRIEESTAILERYFIISASYPRSMVTTKTSHLLYLDRPAESKKTPLRDFLASIKEHMDSTLYPIANGY